MTTYLNIPDLPTTVSVQNLLNRVVRISGIRDIPALATVVVPLNNMSEARRLRRWKSLKSAIAGSVLAFTAPDPLWGSIRIKNLTASIQSLGYGITLAANEVRDISLSTTTVSRRIRLWKAIRNATGHGTILYETTPSLDNPTVTAITPNTADLAGIAVTITGEDFAPGATVTIGGVAATSVVVVDDSTITCVAPVGTAGVKSVVVTNSVGHAGTLASAFTYTAASFVSISPVTGAAAGGDPVTITGTNFKAGVAVTIGGQPVTSLVRVSATQITAVTPAHAVGAVNVVITNPGTGGSVATGTGAFTFT